MSTDTWFLRIMMQLPWLAKETNYNIITYNIVCDYKKQTPLSDHIMRTGALESIVMTGKISDRRGRPKRKYSGWSRRVA